MARLKSGAAGILVRSFGRSSASSLVRRRTKGMAASASTSPVRGSIAIAAPLRVAERLVGCALQPQVDRRDDVGADDRLVQQPLPDRVDAGAGVPRSCRSY